MSSKKRGGPRGMILLAKGNRILEETVKDQICRDPSEKRQQMLDVKLCDFDEVSYNVKIDGSGDKTNAPMVLAISCPAYHAIKEYADTELKKTFPDMNADDELIPSGYDVGLAIDLDKCAEMKDDEKNALVKSLSTSKFTLLSGPFRKYFDDLSTGVNCGENFQFDLRHDTTVYFCPRDDRVTIVYAVDFQEKVDKVIARVFMQELCDARKRVRTAPPFSWSTNPPKELNELGVTKNPGILGYASLAVMATHVKGAKSDQVIEALINFRTFIQYHLKCAKSYFHSRMRKRCTDLLKILNRAKVSFGKKEKKTKSGKTFKRK